MKDSTRAGLATAAGMGIIITGLFATTALGYWAGGKLTDLAVFVSKKIMEGGSEKIIENFDIDKCED